jgi:hypothetical protein
MAPPNLTPRLAETEEALSVLFCLIDDAYTLLNPRARSYESIKRLSDSEVIALALFQQLRGIQSERSFLRDAQRFFSHLFPGVVGLHPSSFHRRVRRLRCFLEPLRRQILTEMIGEPETLLIDEAKLGYGVARSLLGDLAYRSGRLRETLAEVGIVLATERSGRRPGVRQRVEIAISSLKRVFGVGETLATTLVGLATRIAAKICAYTYAFLVNRMLGRPQGHIKELWA